ncbi:MAG: prephenate dehydrogenase/arogenate dehydrogenase family protein [Prosthecochloris sp.]|nr:prephenate dehydrogenase/arogenate dehydrogenase family protein [Prosthecochloris sp.]
MAPFSIQRIAIVGLGLIGASLLQALKQSPIARSRAIRFQGYDPAFDRDDIGRITQLGLDRFEEDQHKLYQADLVILAAPVTTNIALLDDVVQWAPPGTLVTDVSSTKQAIADKAAELGLNFIGMHPLAGSEQQGYSASREELFENKPLIICAENRTISTQAARDLLDLMESLRCAITVMSPEEHDRIVASISHLPQLLSTTLINHCGRNLDTSGPGFATLTRLAASPWNIWRDIISTNGTHIAAELRSFSRELEILADDVEQGSLQSIDERFRRANKLYSTLNRRTST